jgi:dolichyl-phosphate beta-glucosyltransferase
MSNETNHRASNGQFRCTLVLPTYNAADFIESTVARLRRFVGEHSDWSVLFVCDGCSDGTAQKLAALVDGLAPRIRVEAYESNRGKGYALRRGLSMADTPYRVFTDVDLAYDPDEALKILGLLTSGADVVVANRASPDSQFLMSPRDFPTIFRRHVMSRGFNWWLRRMLPIIILDTQAGLKGVSAQAWDILGPRITSEGFFFDVELLARAGAAHMRMEETPILVKYNDPTTVRMLSDGWSMIKDTIRLRRNLSG